VIHTEDLPFGGKRWSVSVAIDGISYRVTRTVPRPKKGEIRLGFTEMLREMAHSIDVHSQHWPLSEEEQIVEDSHGSS
jgi:hypothetical protein